MNKYIVNWLWSNGVRCYVAAKIRGTKSEFTSDIKLAKRWKTRGGAERWIALRGSRYQRYEIIEVGYQNTVLTSNPNPGG